jgi:glutathione S-transferase
MKLYGHFLSAPSNKARLAATAVGQDFEYVHVELTRGEHRSDEYLSINPVGKVPALQDGDFCLYESNAIARYIANKNNSSLYPADVQQRAMVDQWMDFGSTHILANMGKILFNKFFAASMGTEVDLQSMADGEKFLNRFLPIVESQLTKNSMLTGDTLSLADTGMIAALDPFEMIAFDLTPYPYLVAWRNNLMAQDFYKSVHSHFAVDMK